jgi:hypothetical protein
VNGENMSKIYFILLPLILSAMQIPSARAQAPANPTAEQLMLMAHSQPAVDIAAPVTATAAFDPPQVRPGEKSIYRVRFNATAISAIWPEKIPAPPQLEIHLNCSGQTMEAVGNEFQNFATFDYDVRADATGQFTVPEFAVEIYGRPVTIPAAQLEVRDDLPEPHETARQLLVQSSATNVFVGQAVDVRVILPATPAGAIEGVSDLQLDGDSFVVDKNSARQSIRPVELNGRNAPAYVYETSITPIAAGQLNLSAQGFTAGMNFGGPISITGRLTIPGGPPKFVLLDSEPLAINVRPLPVENKLPGFLGAVGSYTSDAPGLATNNLKVGEPVQLTVVIRGQKNLSRIVPPPPPHADGWQVFPAVRGAIIPASTNTEAGASFKYTLIPLVDSLRATPAIPFSCFDPVRGDYVDLTIPSLPVTVLPGENIANADAALMLSENSSEPDQKSGLGKLALSPGWAAGSLVPLQMRGWFPPVQILPALGFCGLWLWDRRRRFLEQHPEIVRRRDARRALRRELRLLEQAAQKNDAADFVRRAIGAMQIASAPHFPAAPRAMVCGDVLQILTAPERAGKDGETVRRFFSAADAAVFANSSGSQTELLAENSGLKEILIKLEARL